MVFTLKTKVQRVDLSDNQHVILLKLLKIISFKDPHISDLFLNALSSLEMTKLPL